MFKAARIKLTLWYSLIIMVVSLAFSLVIYRAGTLEIERFASAQRVRFERRMVGDNLVPFDDLRLSPPQVVDEELIAETKQRILMALIFINLGIMSIAGVLGYYLSGKTLAPIAEMMDGQYRFISDASHELKTPITAIKTTLEVALRDSKLGLVESKATLQTSLDEVNRLQKLAEGLLEMTHKDITLGSVALNLAGIVETVVKMVTPLAKKKKITLETKIDKVMVMTDESSLSRAILAILDNAIKYSPEKSVVEIAGKVRGKFVELKIRDHGKGIAEVDLEHVFDRFYRSDLARSENGYGLGLSIAKEIVKEHDGRIEIKSKVKEGTTVFVYLPYSARLQRTIA